MSSGLQPERTALAWRRTQLAIVVAALLVGRLALDDVGLPGLATWLVPLALAGAAFVATSTSPTGGADGGRLARLAAMIAAIGAVEAISSLWSAIRS